MVDFNNTPLVSAKKVSNGAEQPIPVGRPLYAMRFVDILDTTFSLYRHKFWLFIGITAIIYGLPGLLTVWSHAKMTPEQLVEKRVKSRYFKITVNGHPIKIWRDLVFWDSFLVNPFVAGALVFAIAQEYLGIQTTIRQVFRRMRFWSILGGSGLAGLATGVLAITVIGLPCSLYFTVGWSLFSQSIMVEGYRARSSLSRSRELVKGSWWRVLVLRWCFGFLSL
jgi:hypothetical protein